MKFSRKIIYISFVLSIFVISIHTYNLDTYKLIGQQDVLSKIVVFFETYMDRLEKVCVPFFFTISGYLFFRTFNWNKMVQKYQSRIKSLLIPYIIWCTLYFLMYAFITHIPAISRYMNMAPVSLTLTYYLQCVWNNTYTTLWFVKDLIIQIIFAPLLYLIFPMRNKKIHWIIISIGSFLVLMLCGLGWIPLHIPYLNVFFLLGSYAGINMKHVVEEPDKKLILPGLAGVIICLAIAMIGTLAENDGWRLLFIISLWFCLEWFSYKKEPQWWMGISFFIYCAHSIILESFEKLWLKAAGISVFAALMDYLFMPLIVLTIIIVIAYLLKRYLSNVWNVLTGNRV